MMSPYEHHCGGVGKMISCLIFMWLVFAYNQYYPHGGMNDLVGTFKTEKEADDFISELTREGRFPHYDMIDKVNTDTL